MVTMGRTAHLGAFARPGARDHAAAMAALATLGIADLAAADYTRISGGQRQLALIARAAQAAPLIVMDEPTASLDFGNQALVLREVRALAAQGYGIVLSTHDPDHAFACATEVALLHDGGLARARAARSGPEPGALGGGLRRAVFVERLASGHTVCAPDLGALGEISARLDRGSPSAPLDWSMAVAGARQSPASAVGRTSRCRGASRGLPRPPADWIPTVPWTSRTKG